MVSSRLTRCIKSVALLSALGCFCPSVARGGTLSLAGSFANFNGIDQQPSDIYGTLSQNNVLEASAYGRPDTLSLTPTGMSQTQINNGWQMQFLNGTIACTIGSKAGSSIEQLTMTAEGIYQLQMSQLMPNPAAYATSSMNLWLKITGINGTSHSELPWIKFNQTNPSPGGLLVTDPDGFLQQGTAPLALEKSWAASFNRSIRGAEGLAQLSGVSLASTDYVTEVSLSLTTTLGAESVYAAATSKLISADIGVVSSQVQPVPEPPTIILAGLGAVAVVANGYRRKKQRRDADAEMPLDAMDEPGAIALTA